MKMLTAKAEALAGLRLQVMELAKDGHGSREIGNLLGLPTSTVYSHVRAIGAPRAKRGAHPVGVRSAAVAALIRAGIEAGRLDTEMALDLGVSRERVRQLVKKLGLEGQKHQNRDDRRTAKWAVIADAKAARRRDQEQRRRQVREGKLAKILPLRHAGRTLVEIAALTDMPVMVVSALVIQAGFRTRPKISRTSPGRRATPEFKALVSARLAKKERAAKLRLEGHSIKDICAAVGLSPSTVGKLPGLPKPRQTPLTPVTAADWLKPENVTKLTTLWSEGHSTADIGRRMGISKNAVVGKAHRLNLPARPSPIKRITT